MKVTLYRVFSSASKAVWLYNAQWWSDNDDNFSPEEVFQVVTAAGRPGQVARVTTFDPLSRHDVRVTRTSSVVIVMAHAHAVKENDTFTLKSTYPQNTLQPSHEVTDHNT